MEDISQPQAAASNFLSDSVLMIRPFAFKTNLMTVSNNYYQSLNQASQQQAINAKALQQFDALVNKLTAEGVKVIITQDDGKNDTPDSVFPNNWVSFHNGKYILYPMFAPNRRLEREIDIFTILGLHGLPLGLLHDYSSKEDEGTFLEGTGSIVLDHRNKIAFAAISPRTNQPLFHQFCSENSFTGCSFHAYQTVLGRRQPIYHTNVMMWVGEGVCAVCFDSIDDPSEREAVQKYLSTDREIIELSEQQIGSFAGNCLMLQGKEKTVIVMSEQAYNAYNNVQRKILSKYGQIIASDVRTIQKYGGGSVRCMLAEIF